MQLTALNPHSFINSQEHDLEANLPPKPENQEAAAPTVNPYWGNPERMVVTIYQASATIIAIASIVCIVEATLLHDPALLTGGVVLLALSAGGILLAHKYRQSKGLNEVTQDLKHNVIDFDKENDELKQANKDLLTQINHFNEENDELKVNAQILLTQIGELTATNEDLKLTIDKLQKQIIGFDEENKELSATVQAFTVENANLMVATKKFELSLTQLSTDHQQLLSANECLKTELSELHQENTTLKETVETLENVSSQINLSVKDLISNQKAMKLLQERNQQLQVQFEQKEQEVLKREEAVTEELEDILRCQKIIEKIHEIAPHILEQAKSQLNFF